jgi:hypothetical protein
MAEKTVKLRVLADEQGRVLSAVQVVDKVVSGDGGPSHAGLSSHGGVVHEVEVPAKLVDLEPAKLLSGYRLAVGGRKAATLMEIGAREEIKAK